jgi:hypothetical protein
MAPKEGDEIGSIRAPPANFNELGSNRANHLVTERPRLDLKGQ